MVNQDKKKPKYNKRKFIATFCVAMALFAAIRHGFSINIPMAEHATAEVSTPVDTISAIDIEEESLLTEATAEAQEPIDSTSTESEEAESEDATDSISMQNEEEAETVPSTPSSQLQHNGHKVIGVWSWTACFPDSQSVQIVAAEKNGIKPCKTREDAQRLVAKHKLVNISNSPFYMVDDLKHSMPYLVPKAQHLLNTICLNFIDSLQVKGIPPHLPMITSVFRTTDDVSKLQRGNRNATSNSCHCYGTTVDITYNRFVPLVGRYDPSVELTRWDLPMKQVLAEVLRDLREQGLCYVKYEYKQACFHLTVR